MNLATAGAMNPQHETDPAHDIDRTIPSDPAEARLVQEDIEARLKAHEFNEHEIFGIRLALEEALINAIKHGNQMDRRKSVRVAYTINADRFHIVIADEGPGFDPEDVPDPTAVENLERPCGRGLMLMRHYMSHVRFIGNGNCCEMMKLRNGKN